MSKILIGCDPEVFVQQQGIFKSAFGLIPGTKEAPFKVSKGAVQVDGMALEFNIDPASSEDEFCINVNTVYAQLCNMVPDYNVIASPVAHFSHEYMCQQHPEALVLGCDPDYNSWTGLANERPDGDRPMRTASGHVHIGWRAPKEVGYKEQEEAARVGRQMDFFLGLPSLFYDSDTQRREMYGKAGCVRYKPYGVEYRTLSNAWLKTDTLKRWVFRAASRGMEFIEHGIDLCDKYGNISEIINTSNKKAAEKIIKAEKLEVVYG